MVQTGGTGRDLDSLSRAHMSLPLRLISLCLITAKQHEHFYGWTMLYVVPILTWSRYARFAYDASGRYQSYSL
jgi:hypothetical protein